MPAQILRRLSPVALLAVAAFAVAGCGRYADPAETISESRLHPAFHGVELSGSMTVAIEVGPAYSVRVEGDADKVVSLQTSVRDGILHVRASRPSAKDSVEVVITTPDLAHLGVSLSGNIDMNLDGVPLKNLHLSITGVGKLEIYGIDADKLVGRINGTGKLVAHGNADDLVFELKGVGSGDFKGLCAMRADFTLRGAGSVTAVVADELVADLNGAGSVSYYGAPMVAPTVTGPGSVRSLGDATWCESTQSSLVEKDSLDAARADD